MIREGKNWQDIGEEEQQKRADRCIKEVAGRYKDGLLYSTERDAYLITRLRRLLVRSVWAITKQMERGLFKTVDSEISFEILHGVTGDNIVREIEDEDSKFRLIGRIDRIDKMEKEDRVYLKVVDYKTSKESISLSDLYYGLQMQLMIYLKAGVEDGRERERKLVIPAGVLYYNIDDPMVEGKAEPAAVEQAILEGLKMDGILNEDDPVLPSLDSVFQTGDGRLAANMSSDILPFATNKDGMLKKTSKTVTTEEFAVLMDYTERKLQQIQREIMEGTIKVNPYRKQDKTDETACRYCPYHSICRFDTRIAGNSYRILEKLGDSEVLDRIRQENEK